ncbi:MAG: hypothetical protein QF548_11985, partial [Acidimicrobiales bacterium]|nr:hypothetical protein [Acidimicrobiales bacterium]
MTDTTSGGAKFQGFLTKHDANGDAVWGKGFRSSGNAWPMGIAVQGSHVYTSGSFAEWMDFDPSADETIITSAGNSDGFVAKYSSSTGELADGNSTQNP